MYADQKQKMVNNQGKDFFIFHSELTQGNMLGEIPNLLYNIEEDAEMVRNEMQVLRQQPDSQLFATNRPAVLLMDFVNDASRGLVEYINDVAIGAHAKTFQLRLSINNRGSVLVIEDFTTDADCRYAFFPDKCVDYGADYSKIISNKSTIVMKVFPNGWSIQEEIGILIFRYHNNTGADTRYAFFPGKSMNFGTPRTVNLGVTRVLYTSDNWLIQEENGALCFRDRITPGDNRYAFFCGNYMDM